MDRLRCFIFIGAVITCWTLPTWAQSGPQKTVQEANQQIQKLVSTKAPDGSPAATKRDKQLGAIVSNLLDLDYMAEKALGRNWASRNDSERQEYLSLMRQLVERSYLRQARGRVNYTVAIGATKVDNAQGTAEVETNLTIKTRGRTETIDVFYSLTRRDGRWRVTDIETDGASTVRNYRAQFRRIIEQHGFGELITRMRRRLEAGEAEL